MNSVFHKIMSIAMAVLLLASTTSWTVDKHFCMGHLVDISFFSDADDCGMSMDDDMETTEMGCCTDELIVVDGQDNLKLAYDELSTDQQLFVAVYTYSYIMLFEGYNEKSIPFDEYSPPNLVRDVQVLDQTFLI